MIRILIGGCVYRSLVHVGHATSLASLHEQCAKREAYRIVGLDYQHTSNLYQGRCLWLRRAIESTADVAITVDSDTRFHAPSLLASLSRLGASDRAIAIAPVIRKTSTGLALNILHGPGHVVAPSECGGADGGTLWAGGFGLAAFNLQWFRANWPLPHPGPYGEPSDWINQGEDIQMCRAVAERGGVIVPMWVPTAHYDSSGYEMIGGGLDYNYGKMTIHE